MFLKKEIKSPVSVLCMVVVAMEQNEKRTKLAI
jgi:hypothetical protein